MFPLIAQVAAQALQNQPVPQYAQAPQDNTILILGGLVGVLAVGGLIYLAVKH